MAEFFSKVLTSDEIERLETDIIGEARSGNDEAAWRMLESLRKAQRHQREAAEVLLGIVERQCFSRERAVAVLAGILECHAQDVSLLSALGESLEAVRDIDDLNAPPPSDPLFHEVVDRLAALARDCAGRPEEEAVLLGLATSARMLARQHDELAEKSYRRLAEIRPEKSAYHYNLGLFYKTRGRFEEGMRANQHAARLSDEEVESYQWNLGICATGAREGTVALDVWKGMGHKIEMGRFGLPEGPYPQCKVKLAERPLAERSADADDPGLEETIWIERLSPCHGIIRSVLYRDLGIDYGDIILIDGAPITYHSYGDTRIPVFPQLATLIRRGYQFFDFAGTQGESRQLADASIDLDEDTVIYSHSESFQEMCARCWRDPDLDHEHHERTEKHVVAGRIAAPPHADPRQLLRQLDEAVSKRSPCRLYAPDLCEAAGFEDRAEVDRRRFDLLRRN